MLILLLFLVILLHCFQISSAIDTFNQGRVMNVSETIVSAEGKFELGFFNPGNSTNLIYLGIWYKKSSNQLDRVVIWVGNREQPVPIDRGINGTTGNSTSSSCFLTINDDGNLVILDGKGVPIPVTSISSSPSSSKVNTSATLLDSGNLILREINSNNVLWQSFDHPTDTFLVGMKLGYNFKTGTNLTFRSWKSLNDPTPGAYSLFLDPARTKQVFITKGSQKYWTSGQWNGKYFQSIPEMVVSGVQNSFVSNENESYFMISAHNTSIVTRLVLDVSGKAKQYTWSNDAQKWIAFWEQPRQQCDMYAYCGAFSLCDPRSLDCQCLQGFEPYSLKHWNSQDWSGGCVRKNNTWKCRDEEDGFMLMPNVTLPIKFKILEAKSAQECKLACWNNCSCSAYAVSSGLCQVWHSELLNIKPADYGGGDLFLRVPSSQVQNSRGNKKKKKISLILAVSIGVPLMLIFSSIACLIWKRKLKLNREEKERSQQQDLLAFDFSTKTKDTRRTELSNSPTSLLRGETWDVELPLFSVESVSAATDNFSDEKKLGQGGFGPVYKGTLLNGQEVAIKRLSRGSQQGFEELKNEITLIARLQHKNLVKLLGCCIEGEEKILIYEYMPNKSLDLFLFDPTNRVKLNWERRVHIIEGIAQGLLYLHQYSRLRIIHRDLKTSNILLDDEMNPKISDFGMARIFGVNMSQANTMRIVGTYGYMSPEYAMQGIFSIKSDVFSFGVLLLEILSGRKNTSFHLTDSRPLNLIGHAWNLWRSERELEFIDPLMLGNSSSTPLRYIHVALLCVQEKAIDRPTMSEVIAMLNSELVSLPSPNQPAFSTGNSAEGSSSTKKSAASSANDVTITMINGR